jgi:hypothetical protein
MCFKDTTHPAKGLIGVIITLPIREEYWRRLLRGELKEAEIDPESMFASQLQGNETQKIGLHVFHVERFTEPGPGVKGGFTGTALDEVLGRARLRTDWEVIGLSGMRSLLNFLPSTDALKSPHCHAGREEHLPEVEVQANRIQ